MKHHIDTALMLACAVIITVAPVLIVAAGVWSAVQLMAPTALASPPQGDDDAPPALIWPTDDDPELQAAWIEPDDANPISEHDPFWMWWMTIGTGDLDLYEEMLDAMVAP
jgi:hypothetical protein